MVIFRVILILIAFIVVLVLALTNSQATASAVHVFNKTYTDVPVAFVMLYAFAFGALCVGIFTLVSEIGLRSRLYRQKKEQEGLMEELRALRNASLEGEYPPKNPAENRTSADGGA
jgi:uncharacterized integral membrane protein